MFRSAMAPRTVLLLLALACGIVDRTASQQEEPVDLCDAVEPKSDSLALDDWSPLRRAVHAKNVSLVFKLLVNGADVNDKFGSRGWTVLHQAAGCNGHYACTALVLQSGADVDARAAGDETPLLLASRNGHDQTVSLLLQYGADKNIKANGTSSPLEEAIAAGHKKVIRLLAPRELDSTRSMPSLVEAVKVNDYAQAAILLANGADVNERFNDSHGDGWTPLHFASAAHASYAMAALLLQHGADVNAKEQRSNTTPLFTATSARHDKIVSLLLQYGADGSIKSGDDSPLDVAYDKECHAIIRLLNSPLRKAHVRNRPSLANVLLPDSTPAVSQVQLLLENGADANEKFVHVHQPTPLHVAVMRAENVDLAALLLRYGADVNARGGENKTPLYEASYRGHDQLVSLLLKRGADPSIGCDHPWCKSERITTPLQVAETRGQDAVKAVLLAHAQPKSRAPAWPWGSRWEDH